MDTCIKLDKKINDEMVDAILDKQIIESLSFLCNEKKTFFKVLNY